MKKILFATLLLLIMAAVSGCGQPSDSQTGDLPPTLDLYGQKYVAPYLPVEELPEGYTYLGELSEEQANGTGLAGCKMYAVAQLDSLPDFYLYQECGTPIDDHTIDAENRQWAYVQCQEK